MVREARISFSNPLLTGFTGLSARRDSFADLDDLILDEPPRIKDKGRLVRKGKRRHAAHRAADRRQRLASAWRNRSADDAA